ncbi:MAG TPA: permease [Candidatus Dormibacteraeota bacterium]|nr:permease [Candidatus Dormibacteraeota bacterium]
MDLASTWGSIFRVFMEAAIEIVPFFLLAVFLGSLLEEFVSERTIGRFLTGRQPGTMLLASVTGALIPLCTCGMVPLAVSLRRRGGDLKHTFAFLTAGATVSFPVLLLTWKVLGTEWMLVRLLVSILFGLLVGYAGIGVLRGSAAGPPPGASPEASPNPRPRSRAASVWRRFWGQMKEYFPWVVASLALAAVVDTLVPRHWIHVLYGQKMVAGSLLASLSGIPFYFCSGAELPLVRELIEKGMGTGPATAMLLAVPIVNILTFGVVSRWLGTRGAFAYLALCVASSTVLGSITGLLWR